MRKTFGICVAASLALWLGGCGDDEGACVGTCEEVDAGTSGSTSSGTTSGGGTTSSGTTSSSSVTDAGSTSVDSDAATIETDAAVTDTPDGSSDESTSEPAPTDGGVEGDAGDAGADGDAGDELLLSAECAAACATALEVGCSDQASCQFSVCGIELDSPPGCEAEVAAYLECVADADPETEFECEDDAPMYNGNGCDDALLAWIDCTNPE